MKSLPEPSEHELFNSKTQANKIWQGVVISMTKFTNDNIQPKFIPPDELLNIIRPIAASFTLLHFTPFPTIKSIYKSRLYALFYFTIICGVQIYIQQRSLMKQSAPYFIQTDEIKLRQAKEAVIRQLTEGIKVHPPVNNVMDLALSHIAFSKGFSNLNIKQTEFDQMKFNKFLPVTLIWGYLFAMSTIIDA